jgi:hypothetical protein
MRPPQIDFERMLRNLAHMQREAKLQTAAAMGIRAENEELGKRMQARSAKPS